MKEYIYVYGIIKKGILKLSIRGLRNKPVTRFYFKDLCVLTSLYPCLDPVLDEEEAMLHSDVLKKVVKKTAVIPMSFGMVFKDEKKLEAVLSKSYTTIKSTLELMKNKLELGVKVVKNQLGQEGEGITSKILEPLKRLSVESINGGNFSERLLLNYSFLVEKNTFSKFSNKIADLEEEYKDFRFIYTGPWPPYSFVKINIRGN